MQINTKLSDAQLDAIADAMGCELIGDKTSCLLRPVRDDYRAANRYGRRLWACSFAGHYVLMRAVYELDPDAIIKTSVTKYKSRDDFKARAFTRTDHKPGFGAQAPHARQAPGHVRWRVERDLVWRARDAARDAIARIESVDFADRWRAGVEA